MNDLAALLPLVAILALFWFMVVRPQQRRQREVTALQSSIEVGQRVMMSSGIYGTIRAITDDTARLEIAPGTEIEIARAAIAKVDAPRRQAGQRSGRRSDRRCLIGVRPRRRSPVSPSTCPTGRRRA